MERKADRKAPWCEPSQPPCLTPRKTAPRVSAPALDHRPDRRPSPVPFVLKTVGPRCKLPTRALKIAPTVSLPQLPRPCRAVNYRHGPWFCERTFAWALSLAARPPLPLSLSLSFSLSTTRTRPSCAYAPRSATGPSAAEKPLARRPHSLAPLTLTESRAGFFLASFHMLKRAIRHDTAAAVEGEKRLAQF